MERRNLEIELTKEQARLYMTSATFKTGVDVILGEYVPMLLDGLANKAEQADWDMQARIRAMHG